MVFIITTDSYISINYPDRENVQKFLNISLHGILPDIILTTSNVYHNFIVIEWV